MNKLLLQDNFLKMVEDGIKTVTVRKGIRYIKDTPILMFEGLDNKKEITVLVKNIEYLKFSELNVYIAEQEGMSLLFLKKVLKDIYPDITDETYCTIIYFEVI